MSLELQEDRLNGVLVIIDDARIPPSHVSNVAQNIKSALQGWKALETSLAGLRQDMEMAIILVQSLPEAPGLHEEARVRMLEHFQHDLGQIRASQDRIQQSMETLYVQYYELI